MKIGAAIIALTAWSLTAGTASATPSEVGYASGTLAVADLMEGRLDRAEHVLAAQNAEDARDPARLINLGIVYARSGRVQEARNTFAAVNTVPDQSLILSDGREISSRVVAREQMARLNLGTVAAR